MGNYDTEMRNICALWELTNHVNNTFKLYKQLQRLDMNYENETLKVGAVG